MSDPIIIEGVRFVLLPGGHTPERRTGMHTNGPPTIWWYDAARNRWRVCPERLWHHCREHLAAFGRSAVEDVWRRGQSIEEATAP